MKGTFLFREGTVSYSQKGKGRAVFLLHGYMETKEIWNYYLEMLSKYFRVICIDLPGHGGTDCFGYVHEMELMADCIRAMMKHLKLRKIVLVGHSMGGYASLAFAEKYPDHVAGLCLFHSTSSADSELKKKDRDRAVHILKKNAPAFINEALPNLFHRQYKSYGREIRHLKNRALKIPVQGLIANMEGMKIRKERTIVLRFAPYPVLFLLGKEDNLLPYEDLLEQSEMVSHAQVTIIEDIGHMGFIEAKDRCWVSLLRFIKSI